MTAKKRLRHQARQQQAQRDAAVVQRHSQVIADHVERLPVWAGLGVLHSYVGSLPGEIMTRDLIAAAQTAGASILVPFVDAAGPPMRHVQLDHLEQLQSGHWGLQQPESPMFVTDLASVDLVLVPGLLFDRRGYRIGQGGGYYDRFLATLPAQAVTVGLTYDDSLIDRIPAEPHDVAVHLVITPSGVHTSTSA